MEVHYDYYAMKADNIDQLADDLKALLNIEWRVGSSSYWGTYYKAGAYLDESIRLRTNYEEGEGEWGEPNYKEYPFLLWVEAMPSTRAVTIEQAISSRFKEKAKLILRYVTVQEQSNSNKSSP